MGRRWRDRGQGDGLVAPDGSSRPAEAEIGPAARLLSGGPNILVDARLVAVPSLHGRFRDLIVAAVEAFVAARTDDRVVDVVTCAEIEGPDDCAQVLGCPDACAF